MAALVVGLIAAGVFIGVCSGLLGIGGGVLMVPFLRVLFSFDAHVATATSLFTIIPTSISGTAAHIKNRTCLPAVGVALGVGGSITSTLGVYLGSISPEWLIMLITAAIIAYSAYNMLSKAMKLPRTGAAQKGGAASAPTDVAVPPYQLTKGRLAGAFGIGLIAGLGSGYCGVGGGFIMVPLMTALLAVPMKEASGTSLIAILILAVPGTITQFMMGNVYLLAGLLLACGTIPGAVLGAKLNAHMPERQLRLAFAAFLGVSAAMLVMNELGVL